MAENDKKKTPPIIPNKFDKDLLDFGNFESSDFNKGQDLSMPKYNDPDHGERSLVVQTPWMCHNVHGIPMLGEFYPTDDDRDFLKIPLDYVRNDKIKPLRNMLLDIDKKLCSNDFKKEKFGDNDEPLDNYTYRPIVRLPKIIKNKKGTQAPPPKPAKKIKEGQVQYEKIDNKKVEFLKAGLSYDYSKKSSDDESEKKSKKNNKKKSKKGSDSDSESESESEKSDSDEKKKGKKSKFKFNKNRTMNTRILHYDASTKKNTPIPCKNMTDIEKAMPFGSWVRYVIRMNKVGVMKSSDEYGKYPYNAGWKVLLIQIKPRESSGISEQINEDNLNTDSDDQEEITSKSKDKKKSKKDKKKSKESDSEDEEDNKKKKSKSKNKKLDDDDEDSDGDKKAKNKKNNKKKDSDDESEDEKPKKKNNKKKDSDDESEDEKPKKKDTKKKDSDDESEDEKPKKKDTKKKKLDEDSSDDDKPKIKSKGKKTKDDSDDESDSPKKPQSSKSKGK